MTVRPGSMGKPLPGIEAALVHRTESGGITLVQTPDEQGELALRAGWPSMFRGYLGEDERYRRCFIDGWYRSGDMVQRDADGYFWFVGRSDDVIKSAGHLIGPFEVESVLMEHPAVAEAAVIGVPDARWGEVGRAFVIPRAGATLSEDQVIAHCAARLAKFKVPVRVVIADTIPRTASGKVQKHLLPRD